MSDGRLRQKMSVPDAITAVRMRRWDSGARSSFEPPAAKVLTGRHSFESQPISDRRQALRERPRQSLRDATNKSPRPP